MFSIVQIDSNQIDDHCSVCVLMGWFGLIGQKIQHFPVAVDRLEQMVVLVPDLAEAVLHIRLPNLVNLCRHSMTMVQLFSTKHHKHKIQNNQ